MSGAPRGLRITDVHVHIMPWRMMKPAVAEVIWRDMPAEADRLRAIMDDPALLLEVMDSEGIDRVGLVNYVSPHVMGWTPEVNDFSVRYASHAPERLIPYGGVDPRTCPDAAAEMRRIADLGVRVVKIHPCHMRVAANAYTEGLDALATIYRECEARGVPVMIHTGTSVFPGARSKYGNPMELDDVAIDFPDLRIVMAHGGRPLWMAEAFFILRRHPNVWLDLSGIPPRRIPEWFPQLEQVAHKVLWGTDWPSPGVTSMRRNVEQFLALPYPEPFARAVLEENARRLLP
jgi:predicted TIM-barrel fold metal-dependent hydrolase